MTDGLAVFRNGMWSCWHQRGEEMICHFSLVRNARGPNVIRKAKKTICGLSFQKGKEKAFGLVASTKAMKRPMV